MKKNNCFFWLSLAAVLLFPRFVVAQNEKKWELKLSYSDIHSINTEYQDLIRVGKSKPHFRLDGTYNIFKGIVGGGYFGYSSLYHFHPAMYETTSTDENGVETIYMDGVDATNAFFYGIRFNYQLLPLFLKEINTRFDIYATAKLGAVTQNWKFYEGAIETPSIVKQHETILEYAIGLGTSYYFTKNIGLFGEYNFGHFINDDNSHFQAGLTYKF